MSVLSEHDAVANVLGTARQMAFLLTLQESKLQNTAFDKAAFYKACSLALEVEGEKHRSK